jgi:hypothetical protein
MSSEYVKLLNALPRPDLYDSWELVKRHMPIEQPPASASYIVFQKGGQCYAKNGTTGHIEFGPGDAASVIQSAINALTSGGKIFVKSGLYDLQTNTITLGQYMTLEGESESYLDTSPEAFKGTIFKYSGSDYAFKIPSRGNTPHSSGNNNIVSIKNFAVLVYGSTYKGGIDFSYVDHGIIENVFIRAMETVRVTNSIGLRIQPPKGNAITLINVKTYGFYVGFHISNDWVNLYDCKDFFSRTGFLVNNANDLTQWPIGINFYRPHAFANTYRGFHIEDGSSILVQPIVENLATGGDTAFLFSDVRCAINPIQMPSAGYNGVPKYRLYGTNKIINDTQTPFTNGGTATFSGNGSNKVFTIAHGLASAPTKVLVTAGSDAAKGDFYVTADATNITVTYATAPASGTNNVVLNWYAEV